MTLGAEAQAFVRAVWLAVLLLNLVGVGLLVVTFHRFGIPEPDRNRPEPDSRGPFVRGSREIETSASDVEHALPKALLAEAPWSEILSTGGGRAEFLNRRLVGRSLFFGSRAPHFGRGSIRVEPSRDGGSVVRYELDYSHFASTMWRAGWIAVLFFTLPNLVGKVPLDWYVRVWQPEWRGISSLGHLFHLMWPPLVYLIYRVSLSAGHSTMLAVIDRAAQGASHAG